MRKTLLITTALSSALGAMTAAERAVGRYMRAPDGHDGGDGAAAAGNGEANAGADAGAAQAGEGGGDAGASGAAADAGDDTTLLGGAGNADAGTGDKGKDGKAGEGADGAKAGEGETASGPPEKYELTAPDGFEAIDTEVLSEAEPTLKELNLSNEQAQKLMPLAGQLVKKAIEKTEAAFTNLAIETRRKWEQEFDADPEIGGANKDKTVADARRALAHYGIGEDSELSLFFEESGKGNHPEWIRFVARVGRDLAEGSFDRGDAAPTKKTKEQALYGPEFQPKG